MSEQDPPLEKSPLHVVWDPYPGAAYYKIWSAELKSGWSLVRSVANGDKTTSNEATYTYAPVQAAGNWYELNIGAFDAHDTMIAQDVYSDDLGYPALNIMFTIH